jgi:hypothetical protein
MKSRCERPADPKYSTYGGRGIRVCARWQVFANFYADVGERPTLRHTLERINNDADYEPGNVVWANPVIQANNRRTSLRIEIGGQTRTLAQWCRKYEARISLVSARMKRGWAPLRALTERPHKPGGNMRKVVA